MPQQETSKAEYKSKNNNFDKLCHIIKQQPVPFSANAYVMAMDIFKIKWPSKNNFWHLNTDWIPDYIHDNRTAIHALKSPEHNNIKEISWFLSKRNYRKICYDHLFV